MLKASRPPGSATHHTETHTKFGSPLTVHSALALAAVGMSTFAGLVATLAFRVADVFRPALANACASIPNACLQAMQALLVGGLVAA